MANVQFDEPTAYYSQGLSADRRTFMVKTLMNWGVAKTQTQANYILIGVIIVTIGLSILILINTLQKNSTEAPQVVPDVVKNMTLPPKR